MCRGVPVSDSATKKGPKHHLIERTTVDHACFVRVISGGLIRWRRRHILYTPQPVGCLFRAANAVPVCKARKPPAKSCCPHKVRKRTAKKPHDFPSGHSRSRRTSLQPPYEELGGNLHDTHHFTCVSSP